MTATPRSWLDEPLTLCSSRKFRGTPGAAEILELRAAAQQGFWNTEQTPSSHFGCAITSACTFTYQMHLAERQHLLQAPLRKPGVCSPPLKQLLAAQGARVPAPWRHMAYALLIVRQQPRVPGLLCILNLTTQRPLACRMAQAGSTQTRALAFHFMDLLVKTASPAPAYAPSPAAATFPPIAAR